MQRVGPIVRVSSLQSDEGDGVLFIVKDRLLSFSFVDKDRGVDKAEIVLKNEDRACSDSPFLRIGEKFLISWGWVGEMSVPRRMIVKKAKAAGFTYTVTCHDESVLMDKKRVHRSLHGVRDSDVVREILKSEGYDGLLADIVETEVVRDSVVQNCSNARMIQRLATRNRYVWWFDAAGAHFKPRPTAAEATKWFTYRGHYDGDGEILSPGPTIDANLAKDMAKVRVSAIDLMTGQEVFAEAGATDEEETLGDHIARHIASLGDDQEVGDVDNPEGNRQARISREGEASIGFGTQDEVNEAAESLYREIAGGRYKMDLPIRGEPTIGAKRLIGLRNYSDAHDGLYYVYESTTEIRPGEYKQTLRTRRDALGKLFSKKVLKSKKKKNKSDDSKVPKKEDLRRVPIWGIDDNNKKAKFWAYVDNDGQSHHWDQMSPSEAAQNQLPGI